MDPCFTFASAAGLPVKRSVPSPPLSEIAPSAAPSSSMVDLNSSYETSSSAPGAGEGAASSEQPGARQAKAGMAARHARRRSMSQPFIPIRSAPHVVLADDADTLPSDE